MKQLPKTARLHIGASIAVFALLVLAGFNASFDHRRQTAAAGDAIPSTVYVSPSGNDANDGSSASPFATVEKAISIIDSQSGPGTIILKSGTYNITKTIAIKPPASNSPNVGQRLTIRGEGSPIIYGGTATDPKPLDGEQGIYLIDGTFTANLPGIWDESARARYNTVADINVAKATDYSMFYYSPTQVAIHPKNGQLPPAGSVKISLLDYGIDVTRDNVTIDGISFRGFLKSYVSAGIHVGYTSESKGFTDNVKITNCNTENSYIGFYFGRGTKTAAIDHSSARDVASGINQWGGRVTAEYNQFFKDESLSNLFGFRDPDPMSGQFGMIAYYNSTGVNYHHNLVSGFQYSIFIKTVEHEMDPTTMQQTGPATGPFIVEHNTLIDNAVLRQAQGVNSWGVNFVRYGNYGKNNAMIRYNVMYGFSLPFSFDDRLAAQDATVDKNIFWTGGAANLLNAQTTYAKKISDAGMGENTVADPLFVNASSGDYHVFSNSPAIGITGDGSPAGAFSAISSSGGNPSNPVPPSVTIAIPSVSNKQYGSRTYTGAYDIATTSILVTVTPSSAVSKTKVTITNKGSGSQTYTDTHSYVNSDYIPAPADPGQYTLGVSVEDASGAWSNTATVEINRVTDTAQFDDSHYAKANMYGFVVFNKNSQNIWQYISYRKKGDTTWIKGFDTLAYQNTYSAPYNDMRNVGEQPMIVTGLEPNTTYEYKITPRTNIVSPTYEITTSGSPTTYYVSSSGTDARDGGSRSAPLKTLQYAIDLSLPGDDIRLLPGVYFGPFVMFHSGVPGHPITIEADQPGTVALDGQKNYNAVILVSGVSNVIIKNLTIQWANSAGLYCYQCNNVEIANNVFRNAYIGSHNTGGNGIAVSLGDDLRIHHNLIYGWWRGVQISSATRLKLDHNTITAISQASVNVIDASKTPGAEITYNSINFVGDHWLEIAFTEASKGNIKIDYNNIGTSFQSQTIPKVDPETNLTLPYTIMYSFKSREFVYTYSVPGNGLTSKVYYSFSKWKSDTGYDTHSIFADPKWEDPANGKFNLKSDSPNLLPDGNYIGAFTTTMVTENIPNTPKPPATNAICSTSANQCNAGIPINPTESATQYTWNCQGLNGGSNTSCSLPKNTNTDTGQPQISSVNVSSVTPASATISWSTDETSTSQVSYGLTNAYGSNSGLNSTQTTSHTVSLTGLNPNTTYHFKVISTDSSGNTSQSSDYSFTTPKDNTVIPNPINGACSYTKNVCNSGTLNDITDSNTQYLWQCTGSNGGVTAYCTLNKQNTNVRIPTINNRTPNTINQQTNNNQQPTTKYQRSIVDNQLPSSITRNLEKGNTGMDVKLLQKTLNALGFTVSETGTFDDNTANALGEYQASYADSGIVATKKLDNVTLALINGDIKKLNIDSTNPDINTTTPRPSLWQIIKGFFVELGVSMYDFLKGKLGF
ncbi:MAG: right-handed parallel beta-helix repeat-containing protein [Patescibacteria group bacterium]|nr:right-handed parallel beta-helix repeat-containing protein [Patescibacteria group bacterium]